MNGAGTASCHMPSVVSTLQKKDRRYLEQQTDLYQITNTEISFEFFLRVDSRVLFFNKALLCSVDTDNTVCVV